MFLADKAMPPKFVFHINLIVFSLRKIEYSCVDLYTCVLSIFSFKFVFGQTCFVLILDNCKNLSYDHHSTYFFHYLFLKVYIFMFSFDSKLCW